MNQTIETLIVGGGQAGLATSYFLGLQGRENLVLEKSSQAGNAWRNGRWDSFCLLTPNWSFRLPGAEYNGPAPDGFMARDEIVASFERYADRFKLPVQYGRQVISIEFDPSRQRYTVFCFQEAYEARNVVVATGLFQTPKLPEIASRISHGIVQLHSGQYHNPEALPPGAILVVGSGQSGCQIAEELNQAGRTVYLSTGSAGRSPRRYRGKDVYEWLLLSGFLDRTVDMLPSPQARFRANPHISGKNGGHSLNLHEFYRSGVRLLGRFRNAEQNKIWFAPDLKENLAKADGFEKEMVRLVDTYISQSGMDAPQESLPELEDGYRAPLVEELQFAETGISTIIWANGYNYDFSLVKLPVLDEFGYPVQTRGRSAYPGLYFVGLPWLYRMKSGLLAGFGEDAELIAADIAGRP